MTRKRRNNEQNETPVFDGELTEETVDMYVGDVEHVEASVETPSIVEEVTIDEYADNVVTLSKEELVLAKKLTGSPILVSEDELEIYQRLAKFNVAADFGDEGFARGFKWKQHCV